MNIKSERVSNTGSSSNEEDEDATMIDLRRGPWTVGEDLALMNYIANNGEGRWNSLARCAGLKRTGKSCRLRWLNYLRPDVRRGNITLEEQFLILELHSRWGNRWSKIAQHLPGRTDNEIKNYWRTRVQKHAKQLKCDVNSKQFKDTMRYLWMPRLVERIQAAAATATGATSSDVASASPPNSYHFNNNNFQHASGISGHVTLQHATVNDHDYLTAAGSYTTPENSSTAASSDSFGTQVSPVSELTEYYSTMSVNNSSDIPSGQGLDYFQASNPHHQYHDSMTSPSLYSFNQGERLDGRSFEAASAAPEQNNGQWGPMDGGDFTDSLWDVDESDMWFLQQQLGNFENKKM